MISLYRKLERLLARLLELVFWLHGAGADSATQPSLHCNLQANPKRGNCVDICTYCRAGERQREIMRTLKHWLEGGNENNMYIGPTTPTGRTQTNKEGGGAKFSQPCYMDLIDCYMAGKQGC